MTGKPSPLIPVYLNQRMVFDLVAMLQGGISTVTRVSESSQERSSTDQNIGAAFGLSNAFASLLKIDLSTTYQQQGFAEGARTAEQERVHTPASLFFMLRTLLEENDLLCQDGKDAPRPGTFLEFSTTLNRNPVIEVIDALHQLVGMADVFTEPEQPERPTREKRQRRQRAADQSPNSNLLKQIEEIRNMLLTGETTDLTSGLLQSDHRAVVTLETQYLNDPSMGDLVDGTFTVLGKVIRVLAAGDGDISLIRKTALARLPSPILEQAFGGLNVLSSQQGFELPEVHWNVAAPVLQVLPVAIFT